MELAPLIGLVGASIYRVRGMHSSFSKTKEIMLLLWSLLLTAPLWFFAPWYVVIPAAAACYGVATGGHGDGIDFGTVSRRDPDEWPNYLLPFSIVGKDGWLHDTLYMMINGISLTLPVGVVAGIYVSPVWGGAIALGGALKGPAYALGHLVPWGPKFSRPGAEMGETLTGLFLGPVPFLLLL